MSTHQYRHTRFASETRALIERMNGILAEYDGQALTARQVY